MKASELLQKARDLIAQPGAWTQGVFARDRNGKPVLSRTKSAVCFCAVGAIKRIENNERDNAFRYFRIIVGKSIDVFNDAIGRTQAEVVAAFDKAIALAKSEGC